jgi:hypothetical protein
MTNTSVVGKALYLELRSGSQTTQVIITPEGLTSIAGKTVPMTCYRRSISAATPRRSWRAIASSTISEVDSSSGAILQLETDHAKATFPDRISFTNNLFNQLIAKGYTMYKQPIAVEVTPEDMQDIRQGKTPYKILGRITRCRRALNFGESLFA